MNLFSKIYDGPIKGRDIIIIHGLFGMSDNWSSLGKRFSNKISVHLIDLRNHGRSPHSDLFNYDVMSTDLLNYINQNNIIQPIIIGHSLGGKVAMNFAFNYPEKVQKLIVADIAPKIYSVDFHRNILQHLLDLNLSDFNRREEIDRALSINISDISIRLFLMKNIYRDESKNFKWRFNIQVLFDKLENISSADFLKGTCDIPTCFLRGGNSNYITEEDIINLSKNFSDFNVVTIDNAGHWLHAEYPDKFYNEVINFSDL